MYTADYKVIASFRTTTIYRLQSIDHSKASNLNGALEHGNK